VTAATPHLASALQRVAEFNPRAALFTLRLRLVQRLFATTTAATEFRGGGLVSIDAQEFANIQATLATKGAEAALALAKKDAEAALALALAMKDAEAALAKKDAEAALALALAKKDAEAALALAKKDAEAALAKKDGEAALAKKDGEAALALAKKDAELVKKDGEAALAKKDAELVKKDGEAALAKKDAELVKKDGEAALAKKDAELVKKDGEAALAKKDAELVKKDGEAALAKKEVEVELAKKDGELRLHHKNTATEALRADLLRGVLSIRALLEALAKMMAPYVGLDPSASVTDVLARIFNRKANPCSGFLAYVEVCAADNHIALDQVLRDGKDLYNALSKPMHSGIVSHPPARLDSEILGGQKSGLLALAALAAFNGRDLRLYDGGAIVSAPASGALRIRVSPASACAATKMEVEGLPFTQ